VALSLACIAVIHAVPAVAQAHTEPPETVLESPTCASCRIDVSPAGGLRVDESLTARYGFNDLVLVDDGNVIALPADDGRWWVMTIKGHLEHQFSRSGEGPGELKQATAVAGVHGDTVAIYDQGLARVSFFRRDGTFLGSTRVPAGASSYLWLGAERGIVVGRFRGPNVADVQAALPYHLVQRDSVLRSFGPLIRRLDPRNPFQFDRMVFAASWGVVAVPHANEYRVELYSAVGDPVGSIVRRAEWFPTSDDYVVGRREQPPSSLIYDGWIDQQNRLWLLVARAAPTWQRAFASTPRRVEGHDVYRIERPDLYYEEVVEVIDLTSRQLIASAPLPFVARYALGGGLVAAPDLEADDGVSLVYYRLTLQDK
jgi:hypothetical protein